jgi:hypothetical protein
MACSESSCGGGDIGKQFSVVTCSEAAINGARSEPVSPMQLGETAEVSVTQLKQEN